MQRDCKYQKETSLYKKNAVMSSEAPTGCNARIVVQQDNIKTVKSSVNLQ